MLNPFFQQGSKTEQGLLQDLINEQLKMYGVDVYYLPRKYMTINPIPREVVESKFDNAWPIEAYIQNYEGYDDPTTILSKFGLQSLQELNVIISKERWELYIKPLIEHQDFIKESSRPLEGDLIWFPFDDRLFEIKFVEHQKPWFQLRENYVYELRCELFRYEDEKIDTGIDIIDDNIGIRTDGPGGPGSGGGSSGNQLKLNLIGAGDTSQARQATAICGICYTGFSSCIPNNGVQEIIVTNRGEGYNQPPSVIIEESGCDNATGISSIIFGLINCDGTYGGGKVQDILLTNAGCGYSEAPSVDLQGGGGHGAEAYARIAPGTVGIITITDGGAGYNPARPPKVTFSEPGGIGTGIGYTAWTATGIARVGLAGSVTNIFLTNAGAGYTQPPTITIDHPFTYPGIPTSGIGTGTYHRNETVTGNESGHKGFVNFFHKPDAYLLVGPYDGSFTPGELIIGEESGAMWPLKFTEQYNDYGQSEEIKEEIENIIVDWTEDDPFGDSEY